MSKQTVITRKLAVDSPERKPSVFDRLGSKSCVVSGKSVCRSWIQNGTCPLNKACEFAHTHVLISPSKRSNVKVKTMKKSVIVQKKSKEEHKKSIKSHLSPDREWEGWGLGDLEDADEKVLEKRKQELQRELQLQLKKEKELARKKDKRIEKKRAASSSSSSSSTSESSSTSTSSTTTSSEPKKRLSRKRKHHSSSSDSEVSVHRRKKTPKSEKGKLSVVKKSIERKDSKVISDIKSKNANASVAKKSVAQKKSYSPGWEKSKARSPVKQQSSKKASPHHSPTSKNKSPSPRYEKGGLKSKSRGFSPKQKEKDISPKRTMRKVKESNSHSKDKSRRSSSKARASPPRSHKVSPSRSRRHEESTDKRRSHYEERQHSPRRDRSREKDRKRDVRRKRSHDDDNGGLKKGGKILPLKPSSYNKDNGVKKDTIHHKSLDKSLDSKSKDDIDKDRNRIDRDRDRFDKDKAKCEKDRAKHKKSDEHDRRTVRERERERDLDRNSARNRDDRSRDREAERSRMAKEREAERQKIREEALERCRERQRERERLEKERKDREEKKHQRDASDNKAKDFEKELPSLLDLKAENPRQTSDKHLQRDNRRNLDKDADKNQGRDGRDHGTPDKDHERRDLRSVENERRLGDKDYDRRNREGDIRGSSEVRRSAGDVRRGLDDGGDRRAWDEMRRVMDPVHGRRSMDPINDRRQHPLVRRPGDDHYRRGRDVDLDVRDFSMDERQRRKLMHNHPDWNLKDQSLDYRSTDLRDDWNYPDRHPDWNSRYDHKWREHEDSRDGGWSHYPRRAPQDEWSSDWQQEQPRPLYPEERLEMLNEEFPDNSGKRPVGPEPMKEKEMAANVSQEDSSGKVEKTDKEGDALSDISDDPDDILNQDDEPSETAPPVTTTPIANTTQSNASQQIYVRSDEFLFQQRRPLLDCLRERSLDFEEISDEELEEEARVGKGIVDVLGADWAGLVQETRPKARRFEDPGSAHRRWLIDRIILRFGISKKYAGKGFVDKVLSTCKKFSKKDVKEENVNSMEVCDSEEKKENETKEEMENVKPKVEENCEENNEEVYNSTAVKLEAAAVVKPEVEVNLLHPVPALHVALGEANSTKFSLFRAHNRFKRALSARTDLNLRRELCHLPSKEPLHFTPPIEKKLYETSVQLFQCNASTAVV